MWRFQLLITRLSPRSPQTISIFVEMADKLREDYKQNSKLYLRTGIRRPRSSFFHNIQTKCCFTRHAQTESWSILTPTIKISDHTISKHFPSLQWQGSQFHNPSSIPYFLVIEQLHEKLLAWTTVLFSLKKKKCITGTYQASFTFWLNHLPDWHISLKLPQNFLKFSCQNVQKNMMVL